MHDRNRLICSICERLILIYLLFSTVTKYETSGKCFLKSLFFYYSLAPFLQRIRNGGSSDFKIHPGSDVFLKTSGVFLILIVAAPRNLEKPTLVQANALLHVFMCFGSCRQA
jgi:hypothetical protein